MLAVAVLAAAAVIGWWANRETPEEPQSPPAATVAPPAPSSPQPASRQPPVAAEVQVGAPDSIVDVFAVRTWEPPPPPATAAVPAAPQAPPLPFRFMGRIAEPDRSLVFLLLQGDRVLQVRVGDRVGGVYRVEKFEGGQLYFRYQPMNVVQTLAVGNTQ